VNNSRTISVRYALSVSAIFDGFAYLVTRIAHSVYHIILLPKQPLRLLWAMAASNADLNGL
jgi:hypothetical protein